MTSHGFHFSQAVCCGLSDRIARRVDRSMIGGNEEIPKGAYQTQTLEVKREEG